MFGFLLWISLNEDFILLFSQENYQRKTKNHSLLVWYMHGEMVANMRDIWNNFGS